MGFEKHGSSPGCEAKKGGNDENNPNTFNTWDTCFAALLHFITAHPCTKM